MNKLILMLISLTAGNAVLLGKQRALTVSIDNYGKSNARCAIGDQASRRGYVLKRNGVAAPCPPQAVPPLLRAKADGDVFDQLLRQRFKFQDDEISRLDDVVKNRRVGDCMEQSEPCSTILMRRIQRARILMDLQRQQSISSKLISDTDSRAVPWRIVAFEKEGAQCTNWAVNQLDPR